MKLSERQWPARRMLLCDGDVGHLAPMPRVSTDGVTGLVECEECGAAMVVVDVLTVDSRPTWASLSYDRGAPLYTTAKLHPFAVLARASSLSDKEGTWGGEPASTGSAAGGEESDADAALGGSRVPAPRSSLSETKGTG